MKVCIASLSMPVVHGLALTSQHRCAHLSRLIAEVCLSVLGTALRRLKCCSPSAVLQSVAVEHATEDMLNVQVWPLERAG